MKKHPVQKTALLPVLLRYLRSMLPLLLAALFFALLSVAAALFAPILIGQAIDTLPGKGAVDLPALLHVLLLLGVDIAIGALSGWLLSVLNSRIVQMTACRVRTDAFSALLRLPLSVLDRKDRGDLMSRITADVERFSEGLLASTTALFTGTLTVFGTLLILFSIHWQIALAVALLTPLSLGAAMAIAKFGHKNFTKQAKTQGALATLSEEYLSALNTVRSFHAEEEAVRKFRETDQTLYEYGYRAQLSGALVNPTTRFVNGLVYAAVTLVGALIALSTPALLSIGQLASVLSYANQYAKPFNEISSIAAQFQTALASARRVFDLILAPTLPSEAEKPALPPVAGRIDFDRVSFSYVKEKPLLQSISFTALPGQRVALVGETGCGKTTLINLLMRFYEPASGRILLDGVPIDSYSRNALRQQFGMVLQETTIFSGSVAENIAMGKSNATRDEIIAAAKAVQVHPFVRRLEHGYDTILSGEEEQLSAGQRQLLCIARVMLANPPMLILDEATSNMDTLTEQKVQQAFALLMRGRTSFVVAHRLSTIRSADQILVLSGGRIAESGTHGELLAANGLYAKLYRASFEPAAGSDEAASATPDK